MGRCMLALFMTTRNSDLGSGGGDGGGDNSVEETLPDCFFFVTKKLLKNSKSQHKAPKSG